MTDAATQDRSISVGRDAVNSTIVSGDGNSVTIYYQVASAGPGPNTAFGANPYVGLLAFTEAEADRFYGREALVGRLWERFRDISAEEAGCRFLAILGPSGCGKSSVAQAGLLAEFARRPPGDYSRMRIAVMTPGERPLEALAAVLARIVTNDPTPMAKTSEFEDQLRTMKTGYDGLGRIARFIPDIRRQPLVVYVDQFEETYSLCRSPEDRGIFIETLIDAASDSAGLTSVIITLRSDFLGATQADNALNQLIAAQNVVVPTMSPEELRKAIAEPAIRAGHPLGEDAVKRLLDEAEGHDGVLPLLQFVLVRIWEGMTAGKPPADTLDDLGGVGGALGAEAERLFAKLTPEDQDLARRAFLKMVTFNEAGRPTRRRVPLAQLVPSGAAPDTALAAIGAVLEKFARQGSRLVTLSGAADGGRTAEVTHEALFDRWPAMKDWLADRREDIRFHQRLEDAAQRWVNAGGHEGALWRGPDLERLGDFVKRDPHDLTDTESEFLAASVEAEAREAALRREATVILPSRLLAASSRRATEDGNAVLGLLLGLEALPAGESDRVEFAEATFALRNALETLRCIGVIHGGYATSVDLSPDGRRIVSTSFSKYARLWGVSSADDDLRLPELHTDVVNQARFSTDGQRLVTASNDETVRIWDSKTGAPLGEPLTGHKGRVWSAAFSADGRWIISGGDDNTVRMWDPQTGAPMGPPLTGHADRIASASFSPDGKRAVTASWDHTARLWDVANARADGAPLVGHSSALAEAAFSPDGNRIVTASDDGTARVWDLEARASVTVLRGHADGVTSARFSWDGKRIVTSSSDRTIRFWDAETGAPRGRPLAGHIDQISSVSFTRDGHRLVSAAYDGVWVWNSTDRQEPWPNLEHGDGKARISWADVSPDGRRAVTASNDKTAIVWDLSTAEKVATLRGHQDRLTGAAFSPDSRYVVTTSSDQTARMWNADTGEELATFVHETWVRGATFSPDGRWVLTTGYLAVFLWDLATATRIREFAGHQRGVNGAAFSWDGRRVVTASEDTTARVWDAATGAQLRKLGHKDSVNSAAFSPDGKRVVTASGAIASFWDPASGARAGKPLVGHREDITTAVYSPNGAQILTASKDGTARFWDVATGAPLGVPLEPDDNIVSAAYSADGRKVITASRGFLAHVWDAPPDLAGDALRAEALRRKPRDLTDEERRLYGLGRAPGRRR